MVGDQTPVEPMTPSTARKRVTIDDFTIKHRLGKGAYGDVFLAIKNSDHKVYALKQIQKRKLQRQQKEYQAMVQKQLLTNFKHPGIVKLRYSFQDKTSLYFVQEYCQGGQFINFIKTNLDKLTQAGKVFYIAQIVNLLQYLHKVGVTHRDLKPQNLMLDKNGHLKLIDFGTAQISDCSIVKKQFKEHIIKLKKKSDETQPQKLSSEQDISQPSQMESPLKKRRSTFVGTCHYISPQLLEHNYCPPSADLWALGCIIYQMYYLETPFKDTYQFAVFQKIKKAEYTFPKNQSITEEAIDLIKKLLVKKPEQRLGSGVTQELSYAKLKAHPYFKGLNIDKIFEQKVPYISGLQPIQKTEQEKKEYKQTYTLLQNKTKGTLELLDQQYQKQVVKHEIMEQKTFICYNYALLILCKDKQMFIVNCEELEKIKTISLIKRQSGFAKLIGNNEFIIYDEDNIISLKSSNAQQWVNAINS